MVSVASASAEVAASLHGEPCYYMDMTKISADLSSDLASYDLASYDLSSTITVAQNELRLRILEAALDAPGGFLGDVSAHVGLSVSETARIATQLKREGLLCALDCEPWAPTVEGYKLIMGRRAALAKGGKPTLLASNAGKKSHVSRDSGGAPQTAAPKSKLVRTAEPTKPHVVVKHLPGDRFPSERPTCERADCRFKVFATFNDRKLCPKHGQELLDSARVTVDRSGTYKPNAAQTVGQKSSAPSAPTTKRASRG